MKTELLELLDAVDNVYIFDPNHPQTIADLMGPIHDLQLKANSIRSKLEANEKAEHENYLQNHGGSV